MNASPRLASSKIRKSAAGRGNEASKTSSAAGLTGVYAAR